MRKPVLTIFYQFNPWHSSIGGIQTLIRSFIKYAPSEFELRLVGTGESNSPVGVWQEAEFAGRAIQFMPLITLQEDNVRSFLPTTLKYTAALFGRCLASDFMHFHRLEPSIAALNWQGDKTLFVHNDIQKQMNSANCKNAILWQRFPAGYFALESLVIKQFTQIIAFQTESAKFYQQRYSTIAERVACHKYPVDNEIFYPLISRQREEGRRVLAQQLGLPEQTRFVLFAGRLHPQKDPILLVRSLATLDDPSVHLLIAGEGELTDEVRSEIRCHGLSERVTMLGSVAQEKLADLHRVCSVFVLTSAYESGPLVVLEALSCGTPVVTTLCGETPKFVSAKSGVICQERTPVAIADALHQVLQHPEAYLAEFCVRDAQPYAARTVVSNVYSQMLERWQERSLAIAQ
jgi:glycosyltransferase involved in cell wall biosynthesis